MNDIEFEQKVKVLLNDVVDAEIGTPRPAPVLRPDKLPHGRGHGPRSRWLMPLLAAACVAAVVAATWGLTAVFRGDGSNNPAKPAGPVVVFAGAHIALPAGWVAVEGARHTGEAALEHSAKLCVRPAGSKPDDCRIAVLSGTYPVGPLGVDSPYFNVRPHCGKELKLVERVGEVAFGGRTSEYRHWDYSCPDTTQTHVEQYVVGYLPYFALYSGSATDSVSTAMGYIAAHSMLPKADPGGLRLSDYGKVVAVTHTPHGDKIVLSRQIRTAHAPGGTQISYGHIEHVQVHYDLTPVYAMYRARNPLPPKEFFATLRVHVGDLLSIATDGRMVTEYLKY